MKQSSAVQAVVWIALGALAFMFLKWWNGSIDAKSAQLMPLMLDSAPAARRLDSLPKPFARLTLPAVIALKKEPKPKRPLLLRAQAGDTVEVSITAYCLRGNTRSGTPTREGVVAADPRVFPLNTEIDVRIGNNELGRFRVEDTGLLIKGRKLDVWLSDCAEARTFGRKRGFATLVPEIRR